MNLEDERRLKFDVRLRGRRGWVGEDELKSYEESLPDASSKIASADSGREDRRRETPGPDAGGTSG